MLATEIEDYPGFPDGVKAPELSGLFIKQAERFGTEMIYEEVTSVDFSKKPFLIKTASNSYQAESVIISTGSQPLWLGLPNEKRLIGKGVSACAVCDGPFFKDKKVVVVGGGDSALKEAIYLSKIASDVAVVHRRGELRAQEALQEEAKKRSNIKFILDSVIEDILGKDKVAGVKIKNLKDNKITDFEAEGVFMAVGHKPATEFLKAQPAGGQGQVDLDVHGYVVLKGQTSTSVPGIFAAGDVADPRYRQISTAVASGAKAALDAEEYLDNL